MGGSAFKMTAGRKTSVEHPCHPFILPVQNQQQLCSIRCYELHSYSNMGLQRGDTSTAQFNSRAANSNCIQAFALCNCNLICPAQGSHATLLNQPMRWWWLNCSSRSDALKVTPNRAAYISPGSDICSQWYAKGDYLQFVTRSIRLIRHWLREKSIITILWRTRHCCHSSSLMSIAQTCLSSWFDFINPRKN